MTVRAVVPCPVVRDGQRCGRPARCAWLPVLPTWVVACVPCLDALPWGWV